jgi:flagella basal body P-ring formation protein FlgA
VIALLALHVPVWAAGPEDAVRDAVAARLGVAERDVEVVEMGSLAGLPEGAECRAQLPRTGTVEGRVPVVLFCGEGRWSARPLVEVWRDLPVVATPARAGEPIEVRMARVASGDLRGEPAVEGEGPWRARVDLDAGAPLTSVRVEPMPDALRGEAVTLVAGGGALAIMARGELLGDAFVGAPVSALSTSTRAVVRGTYRGDGIVYVEGR